VAVDQQNSQTPSAKWHAVDALLALACAMVRRGNTASRTRDWLIVLAQKMGFDAVSVNVSIDAVSISAGRSGTFTTGMREVGPPAVDTSRIIALEQIAKNATIGVSPDEIAIQLANLETRTHLYSRLAICIAMGVASGAFAFLNGAAALEAGAAAVGGSIGQWLRSHLSRRHFNQYGSAALSAAAATGSYVLVAALLSHYGLTFAHYPAGFIGSVLFLVPGFPLIAALFDLLQYQTLAAVSRFIYGAMILLAVAFGVSIVIAVAGIDISRQPGPEVTYLLKLLLRALASFLATSALAMLFNNSLRLVIGAGLLALAANQLRLTLVDFGMMLAPAAFFAALAIGLVALIAEMRFAVPRMALIVPPMLIMVPGIYAFEAIVYLNRGLMLDALQAFAVCSFVIGALAMGLATARLFSSQ
jgi:uncharacterized membrane protein YjjP (DUF1212 family)